MKAPAIWGGGRLARLLLIFLAAAALSLGDSISIGVPAYGQVKNGCGSAVLAMMLDYWREQGISVSTAISDPAAIQHQLYSPAEEGIPAEAMIGYLRAAGLHAYAIAGKRSDLDTHLAKGWPLIVCLRQGGRRHYVVVRGLDPESVWINDPATGSSRRMAWKPFTEAWAGARNWTLLAVPR